MGDNWKYYPVLSKLHRVLNLQMLILKQEGQMALNRSPMFCLNLTYRNLLKADHVPGDTWGKQFLAKGHYLNKLGRGPLGDATYQISSL